MQGYINKNHKSIIYNMKPKGVKFDKWLVNNISRRSWKLMGGEVTEILKNYMI